MYTKEDIITSDAYMQAFPDIYYKTDVIYANTSITWRGHKHDPPPLKTTNIIISGHSDYGIHDSHFLRYSPKIWWTINKETTISSLNIHSLPLGVTNDTNESPVHRIYGNKDIMIKVMQQDIQKMNLAFMNINVSTYHERQTIVDKFRHQPWVTISSPRQSFEGREQFLKDIKAHEFVFCPRGNGVDTHRLWETLYMGSIPIVKKHVAYNDFSDFPICFVNDWDDVTEEFLREKLPIIKSMNFNTERLKITYWIDKIRASFSSF